MVEILFLGIAAFAGWRPVQQFFSFSFSLRLLLTAIVALAFAVAALRAPNPSGSLVWTYVSLIQLLFGLAVAWMVHAADAETRALVWPAIAYGCWVYSAMTAVFALLPHPSNFDWQYFGLAVSNVRQVGFYMAVGTLSAIGCAASTTRSKALLYTAAATSMMTLAFWTGSRGAAIATIAAISGGLLAFPQMRTLQGALATSIPIPLGLLLSVPLPRPIAVFGASRMVESLQVGSADAISGFRLKMWESAWRAFLQRPWIGYGEGQFGIVAPQPQAVYLHPHNVLLQSLVQWGTIGTALCLGLAALAGRHIRSVLNDGPSAVLPAFLVCVGLFVFSLYDGALFHVYPVMMFGFALAFIIGSNRQQQAVRLS